MTSLDNQTDSVNFNEIVAVSPPPSGTPPNSLEDAKGLMIVLMIMIKTIESLHCCLVHNDSQNSQNSQKGHLI